MEFTALHLMRYLISYLRTFIQILLIGTLLFIASSSAFADPNGPPGRIVFIGVSANGERTVWLSLTTAGNFEIQCQNQTVDQWNQPQRGLHVTFSPFVSNGSGDPHSLFQIINGELVFIDKANQQGGITFPPLPGGLPPGQVTPPIALPPTNISNPIVLPGTPTQPIALPGEPTHPIAGPGEPTHPIELPGEPTHPIELPDSPTPPIDTPEVPPSEGQFPTVPKRSGAGTLVTGSSSSAGRARAPLTRGREFAKEPLFNFWMDGRYIDIDDHRYNLDRTGLATNVTFGADRRINSDLVIGLMLAQNTGKSSTFNDNWKANSKGYSLGPYFGYRLKQNWSVEANLGYGRLDNNNNISILNSKYKTDVYFTSIMATGVYNWRSIQLRSKPAIFYNYFHNASYNMTALFNGVLFLVPIASNRFSFGFAQYGLEASRSFTFLNGKLLFTPYVEGGIDYAYVRPNKGQILTGDLRMQKTTPFNGLARLGLRTIISQSLFIQLEESYLSFGQKNLNIWQTRLFLSWAWY